MIKGVINKDLYTYVYKLTSTTINEIKHPTKKYIKNNYCIYN